MVWLTYRQHRLELGAVLFGAVAVALALVAIVQYVAGVKVSVGLDSCPAVFGTPDCVAKFDEWQRQTAQLRGFILALYAYPVIVAAFLAGPMFSRDFERGTHRLVWTQGITRTRWVWTKLAIVLGVATIAALVIAAVGGQARVALGPGLPNQWTNFDFEGPAFVSYLVFAVAIGAAVGVLARRTVLAMLVSLVLFVGIRILMEWKLRPQLLPAITAPAGGPNVAAVPAGAWQLGTRYLYPSGAEFPQEQFDALMRSFRGGDLSAYLRSHDAVAMSFYQPADRYWLFQSIEAGVFIGLSLVLVLFTVWLVRRRA
jgi:hypothetical protein